MMRLPITGVVEPRDWSTRLEYVYHVRIKINTCRLELVRALKVFL
jgi:hypothetical protein